MSINDTISFRGIEEVIHFTTNNGLIGILATKALKARSHLDNEQYLEFILKKNSKYRSDPAWVHYVNLSITKMNTSFFAYCSSWHNDITWCALCLSSSVLDDDGVIFTTTNNIYRTSVRRAVGSDGLNAMYSDSISGKHSKLVTRSPDHPSNLPTDIEAEVLYPEEISIEHLKRIIVQSEQDQDDMSVITYSLGFSHIKVEIDPNFFK